MLNVTHSSKEVTFEDVRNKLQKFMSKDMISFQSKKLLYTQVADFISSQIRIIEEIESKIFTFIIILSQNQIVSNKKS